MDGCGGFFFGVNGCWRGVEGREITWYRVLGWMEFFGKGKGWGLGCGIGWQGLE